MCATSLYRVLIPKHSVDRRAQSLDTAGQRAHLHCTAEVSEMTAVAVLGLLDRRTHSRLPEFCIRILLCVSYSAGAGMAVRGDRTPQAPAACCPAGGQRRRYASQPVGAASTRRGLAFVGQFSLFTFNPRPFTPSLPRSIAE